MLYVIAGPPAAGKTTWVRDHAKHGDITIDFNTLAGVLTPSDPDAQFPSHTFPDHVRMVAQTTRLAAIDAAVTFADACDVYLIHAMPTPQMLQHYKKMNATIITIDPGREIVTQRCKRKRPPDGLVGANRWYDGEPYRASTYSTSTSINEVYKSALGKVGGLPRWY